MMNLNKTTVRKLLKTVDAGLCSGMGLPEPGEMCVEAAVCYALGLPHGDDPKCVGWAVRALVISLNDGEWSSDKARAAGLRKLAVAQLGSDTLDQDRFAKLFALRTVQRLCPPLFAKLALVSDKDQYRMHSMGRSCASVESIQDEVPALIEALEEIPSYDTDFFSLIAVTGAIYQTLNFALNLDREDSNDCSIEASYAISNIYVLSHRLAKAPDLSLDEAFTMLADICTEVLVEMESPGCQWLWLCENQKNQ